MILLLVYRFKLRLKTPTIALSLQILVCVFQGSLNRIGARAVLRVESAYGSYLILENFAKLVIFCENSEILQPPYYRIKLVSVNAQLVRSHLHFSVADLVLLYSFKHFGHIKTVSRENAFAEALQALNIVLLVDFNQRIWSVSYARF